MDCIVPKKKSEIKKLKSNKFKSVKTNLDNLNNLDKEQRDLLNKEIINKNPFKYHKIVFDNLDQNRFNTINNHKCDLIKFTKLIDDYKEEDISTVKNRLNQLIYPPPNKPNLRSSTLNQSNLNKSSSNLNQSSNLNKSSSLNQLSNLNNSLNLNRSSNLNKSSSNQLSNLKLTNNSTNSLNLRSSSRLNSNSTNSLNLRSSNRSNSVCSLNLRSSSRLSDSNTIKSLNLRSSNKSNLNKSSTNSLSKRSSSTTNLNNSSVYSNSNSLPQKSYSYPNIHLPFNSSPNSNKIQRRSSRTNSESNDSSNNNNSIVDFEKSKKIDQSISYSYQNPSKDKNYTSPDKSSTNQTSLKLPSKSTNKSTNKQSNNSNTTNLRSDRTTSNSEIDSTTKKSSNYNLNRDKSNSKVNEMANKLVFPVQAKINESIESNRQQNLKRQSNCSNDTPIVKRHKPNLNLTRLQNEVPTALSLNVLHLTDKNINIFQFLSMRDPILVEYPDNLGILVPENLTENYFIDKLGSNYSVNLIKKNGKCRKIKLREFIDSLDDECTNNNYMNLDLSKSNLNKEFEIPDILRVLAKNQNTLKTSKYCQILKEDSYIDFNVNFTRSIEWFHVVDGAIFICFVEPTTKNLKSYKQWLTDDNRDDICFLDTIDDKYQQIMLKKDETIFLPSNMIYAIYGLKKSILFSGDLYPADLSLTADKLKNEYTDDFLDYQSRFPLSKSDFVKKVKTIMDLQDNDEVISLVNNMK